MVSRSPPPHFTGVTFVTTGYLVAFLATAVPAGRPRTAVAEMARVVMVTREKDMPRPAYRRLDELLEGVRCRLDERGRVLEPRADAQSLRSSSAIRRRA